MRFNTLQDVYLHELKDIHSAEKQIISVLPRMIDAADDSNLTSTFSKHLETSKRQIGKVENILNDLGENPGSLKCKGMEGLVNEVKDVIENEGRGPAKDAALIAASQRIEHYEIAAYGCAATFADELGYSNAAHTLKKMVEEESSVDEILTKLAEGGMFGRGINKQAELAEA